MVDCAPGKEFVFKMSDGRIIGRAKNVNELANLIKTAPLEAVLYHSKGYHFSPWLATLGQSALAGKLKAMSVNEKTIRVALLRALKG